METEETIKNLNQLLLSLDKENNLVGVIKDTATASKIKNMIAELDKSAATMHQAVDNLNNVVTNVKEGKGAFNYLTQNQASAQKIDSVINNVNKASQLLKEDLEAVRHNFLFRGYFKKLEKEKAKQQAKDKK